ncbi:ribosome biogenesis GTP-binding protein YihA/YsxC [uncultured Senegalimassilia sp.]|uniref:ribosome biogenesis GTP-binding protein YihA/YsxC n=1 Tax=uncultured Senegalimassilia sp. TaxID=1714350 RepID=UPI00258757FF|nr:ribosome biogenesis GTP-binding protein YihA/YsxC [uncultured Senegalimassilia sp.]
MNFNKVAFERSFGISSQLPPSTLPEVAFAGRSNVGKSSMLNALFGRKSLAKVSQKPGKTSTINFFATDTARFVDLPGYGYARVAKSEKGRWAELIEGYFNQNRNFALVVSLVDIRHEAQQLDLNMIGFLQEAGLPFAVVLTKADKLSKNQQNKQAALLRRQLALPDDVPMLVTSSEKKIGFDNLRKLIEQACEG